MDELLVFLTCGSVDDGKSTLIGRLLYDAKLIFADQKQALILESKTRLNNGELDYSLLLDGLIAEREQGITIDVAYRYFTTKKRRFIIADTPGHDEYTRNMAVGASFSDLAVLLVDVTKGILPQTHRHLEICQMMGIKHYVFAVNKMDIVDYSKVLFDSVRESIKRLMNECVYETCEIMPVSALKGDNVTSISEKMPWYDGTPLLTYLETIDVHTAGSRSTGFTMPVQRVSRSKKQLRGYQGTIEEGEVFQGDLLTILPSEEQAIVKDIYILDRRDERASSGQPVTIYLDREVDISRGCVLTKQSDVYIDAQFKAKVLWMDNEPLHSGRNYYLRIGTQKLTASIVEPSSLNKNEIAECVCRTSLPAVFQIEGAAHPLGKFILINITDNSTAACGVIENTLERNVFGFETNITKSVRAKALNQKPATIWLTGLSGAGKSTIAEALERELISVGKHTMVLDGDNIRLGINKYLTFSKEDRAENIRTVAEISKLMNDAGLIVITALISPFISDRMTAASIIGSEFIEVYVKADVNTCMERDTKGLYKRALNGEIPEFTGISSPYEEPPHADIVLDTQTQSVSECVNLIIKEMHNQNVL